MAVNISIPKGTRDFLPVVMQRRNYIFSTLREVFCLHGYQPIETPAMEELSTLLGKYGEEGDKLLFRILNSGDFLGKVSEEEFKLKNLNKLASLICEKGLRYDLTVPFARFVVMHRNELTFPFKRYQIQPVWRADRPQKGRYREFYQCDVDVIGSDSLLNELELLQIIEAVFIRLNLDVTIILNNRKILHGIATYLDCADKLTDITVAIDKLDKIGQDGVLKELNEKGFSAETINKLVPILEFSSKLNSNEAVLDFTRTILTDEIGKKGIEEMDFVLNYAKEAGVSSKIKFDLSLARGLSYYTGTILEVKANNVEMGSICGGGRYDNLTGIFGMPGVSGVGMSFGADRIYDVLESLGKFPAGVSSSTKVLFVNFGLNEEKYCLQILRKLHAKGISSEIFPDTGAKMKKQMGYADAKKIPYVVIIGENEMKSGKLSLKNMNTGEQCELTVEELLTYDFQLK
ncbi:MAG: histidine--tRNA ligase [Bacteroidia bacterium]|nr:histidine--tRNA ligase [Bacteroidia bacterium]